MLVIGEIVGAHGIKGEVKVYPHTDYPERYFEMDTVTISKGELTRVLFIQKVRRQKNVFVFQFKGVNDRNQVDELRGWELVVDADDAVVLPEGHYYDHQLIGLKVVNILTDTLLGTIAEVLHLPANAVYRVETPAGESIFIPALKQVVIKVDLVSMRMDIEPLEGLLE